MHHEDILITMQNDLERALQKPEKDRRWAMLIDVRSASAATPALSAAYPRTSSLPRWLTARCMSMSREVPAGLPYLPARPCMQCDKPPASTPVRSRAGWRHLERDQGIGAGIVPVNYASASAAASAFPPVPMMPASWTMAGCIPPGLRLFRSMKPCPPSSTAGSGPAPARTSRSAMPASATSACTGWPPASFPCASPPASAGPATSATKTIPELDCPGEEGQQGANPQGKKGPLPGQLHCQ